MQIGQRFIIIEPFSFRHQPFDQINGAIGFSFETCQIVPPECLWSICWVINDQGFNAACAIAWRHPAQGEEEICLEVRANFTKLSAPLFIDEPTGSICKV